MRQFYRCDRCGATKEVRVKVEEGERAPAKVFCGWRGCDHWQLKDYRIKD